MLPGPSAFCFRTALACPDASSDGMEGASPAESSLLTVRRVLAAMLAPYSLLIAGSAGAAVDHGFLVPAGVTYQLETGKDGNTLHGGGIGYNKREWELVAVSFGEGGGTNGSWAVLSLDSPDGDQVGLQPDRPASIVPL